jgi:alkylhydroperoxidase/carboxymuconolactone decarboxylase family protein YurZ
MPTKAPLDSVTLEKIRRGEGVAGMLETIDPSLTGSFMDLREWAMRREPDSLPFKYKELVLTVMAIVMDADQSAVGHAQRAIEAGLTVREFEDTTVLILLTAGMTPIIKLGKRVLDEVRKVNPEVVTPA